MILITQKGMEKDFGFLPYSKRGVVLMNKIFCNPKLKELARKLRNNSCFMKPKTIKLTSHMQKILIIKPSSLGDVVHSLPFLNAVRTYFSKAEIHWVIAKGIEGLLEGHPMIDRLWIINKDTWKKIKDLKGTINELKVLFKELKKGNFDIVVDLQGLLRSGVLTAATCAPVRIGFKEAREGSSFFYTHKVEGGRNIHAVDRYLKNC